MAWRGIHLSQKARLNLADGQMVIEQADGTIRLALEDLAWLVLDTPQASLTAALLSAAMEAGMVVITTDGSHLPNGLLLPFHGHHRQAGMAETQISAGLPLKKRLWQAIIRAKILHQAQTLELCTGNKAEAKIIAEMARHVGSGDPDNVEARAARQYWQALFPDFRRDDDADRRNKLLNYGYAVVRAVIARALVTHGLLPALGLHHASIGNAFNLADDIIEPFRPLVDRLAHAQGGDPAGDLNLADRRAMVGVLLADTRLGKDTMTLTAATEKVAASLVRALQSGDAADLILPGPP